MDQISGGNLRLLQSQSDQDRASKGQRKGSSDEVVTTWRPPYDRRIRGQVCPAPYPSLPVRGISIMACENIPMEE